MAPTFVSGLYQGEMMLPQAGRFTLDLRVDIDQESATRPVTNRISGDLYQITPTTVPGQPPKIAKTYIESWIIDQLTVNRTADRIEISGTIRYWVSTHPATTATLVITWSESPPVASAEVTFTETGGPTRKYHCRRISDTFRQIGMEIDVCQSVNVPPLLPSYDTDWHADRPPGLPQRVLSIVEAYREAGVRITIDPQHTVIKDSDPKFQAWTPALLHDAMETNYSQFGGTWPDWKMWGLMAGRFEDSLVGGIMFDTKAEFAGAGTERQGFAIFRRHEWFDELIDGKPQTQDQVAAARQFLYTWVHEAGHAFNFLHSWNKGRPDALSWMNYDWKYEQRNPTQSFWQKFAFRFDDDELIHLRHGNRASVIMGGDPWSSGSHLEMPNLAMAQIEGHPPLELIIRSKPYFEFMEPVIVELRLRNLLPDMPVVIDKRLPPEYGGVAVYIQTPDGGVVEYEPIMCAVGKPDPLVLSPSGAQDGTDRYSREIFLSYGNTSFYFSKPGEYRIRAVYQGAGDVLIPSSAYRIRIGMPGDKELDRKAQDYFTDSVGLALYLQGSRSQYLKNGTNVLEGLADQYKHTAMGTKIAVTLANGISKPFFSAAGTDARDKKLVQTFSADPKQALNMTEAPLAQLQASNDKSDNLAYRRVVLRRADYFRAMGDEAMADKEIQDLSLRLQERHANSSVVDRYRDMSGQPEPLPPRPARDSARAPARPSRRRTRT